MSQAAFTQANQVSNAIVLSFTPATVRSLQAGPTTHVAEANDVEQVLLKLEDRRKTWEDGVYRTSNQALYAMLADCMAFAAPLPTTDAARQRNDALSRLLKQRNYEVMASSPLVTRVVKVVFGDVDRRRVSSYSQVLRCAQQQAVEPQDLAAWIEIKGGIQKIRLQQSATFISPQDRAIRAQEALDRSPFVATASSPELRLLADSQHMGQDCVLLAQQQADGSFAIRTVVRNLAAITAARLGYDSAQQAASHTAE
jgi:hypothetical protein